MTECTVLHVGLPKTASTFLQRRIFPRARGRKAIVMGVQCSNLVEFVRDMNRMNLDDTRIRTSTLDRGRNPLLRPAERRFWLDAVYDARQQESMPLLISCEGLVGISWDPLINNLDIAMFLKEAFPACKIVFIFRRQDTWIESLYKQLVYKEDRFGRYLPFAELFGFDERAVTHIKDLDWYKIWTNYVSVFGPENVLALPYEMLRDHPEAFTQSLEDFIGCEFEVDPATFAIRENAGEEATVYLESKLFMADGPLVNRIRCFRRVSKGLKKLSLSGPFRRLFAHEIPLEPVSRDISRRILLCHKRDNCLLARALGLSLQSYGYC